MRQYFLSGGKVKIVASILHNRVWAAILLAGLILPVVVLGGAFARNSSFGILFNSSGIFCSLCRFWGRAGSRMCLCVRMAHAM